MSKKECQVYLVGYIQLCGEETNRKFYYASPVYHQNAWVESIEDAYDFESSSRCMKLVNILQKKQNVHLLGRPGIIRMIEMDICAPMRNTLHMSFNIDTPTGPVYAPYIPLTPDECIKKPGTFKKMMSGVTKIANEIQNYAKEFHTER